MGLSGLGRTRERERSTGGGRWCLDLGASPPGLMPGAVYTGSKMPKVPSHWGPEAERVYVIT